jgi:radical SAM protein with 4Fe4S-binding SPASM domain
MVRIATVTNDATRPPLPGYLQVEPVGQCNLRCQMCPIQFRRDGPPYGPPAFMPFDAYTRLIDEFGALAHLHLQGLGEPMMHPRFFDMVRYAAAHGVRVTTNSNLTLLNARRAAECVASGLAELHVSIDGATAATYERIRVRARLGRVLRNLELLRDAKLRADSMLPRVHVVMVLMRQNLEELPGLVRLAAHQGAEELFVQRLCHDFAESSLPAHYRPMREFVQAQALADEDENTAQAVFEEARAVADKHGIALRLPRGTADVSGAAAARGCDWPWSGAYVSYDGHAMPCCMVATPDRVNFGRVDGRSFAEIWSSDAYAEFRRRLASPTPPEICRTCALYNGTF